MGSSQSYISSEAVVTAVVVAGALGFGYTKIKSSSQESQPTAQVSYGPGQAEKKGKGKKKKQASLADVAPAVAKESMSPVASASTSPAVIPGGFDAIATVSASEEVKPKAKKTKKKKTKVVPTTASVTTVPNPSAAGYNSESSVEHTQPPKVKQSLSSSSQITRPLQQSTMSIDTDGSWTRVESGRRNRSAASASEGHSGPSAELTTSDAGITTPVTGNSSPVAERTEDEGLVYNTRDSAGGRRTLAEKLLPKPRKTGVDDMLETPDYPTLSRVIRVQPLPDEKPASGFSWGDYEDVRVAESAGGGNDADGEDDGWGVVKSKSRSKIDRSGPGASGPSQNHTQKAPDTLTKRQRQNANKREAQKASKAEAEAERLATLARHKRELERTKMMEQFGKGGSKAPSGGMKATVDERGKLVWE